MRNLLKCTCLCQVFIDYFSMSVCTNFLKTLLREGELAETSQVCVVARAGPGQRQGPGTRNSFWVTGNQVLKLMSPMEAGISPRCSVKDTHIPGSILAARVMPTSVYLCWVGISSLYWNFNNSCKYMILLAFIYSFHLPLIPHSTYMFCVICFMTDF